jgi:BASS family bile acid:Na+ symporter
MVGVLAGLFPILIFVTVAITALAVGLVTTPRSLWGTVRDKRLLLVLAVNVLLIPAIGYLIATGLPLTAGSETGVILCVICAGGPLALKATQIARGDMTWSLSLTAILMTLNMVFLPAWTFLLLDQFLSLRPGDLIGVLALAILVPVFIGSWLGVSRPRASAGWAARASSISNVTLAIAVAAGLASNARSLFSSVMVLVGLAVLVVMAFSFMLGSTLPDQRRRQAVVLTTVNRATSVALLVVDRAFPDEPEVLTAAIAYGFMQTVIALFLAVSWRRGIRGKIPSDRSRNPRLMRPI